MSSCPPLTGLPFSHLRFFTLSLCRRAVHARCLASMTRTSPEKRAAISALHGEHFSQALVARRTGVHARTVSRLRQRLQRTGSIQPTPIPGRPRKLSARGERQITRLIDSNQADNAVQAARQFNAFTDQPVSEQTARRALQRQGFVARVKIPKPLLKVHQKKARLAFARKSADWSAADWRRVIFSDETRFKLYCSDGREYVWQRTTDQSLTRRVKPRVKYGGGSLTVWGCLTVRGSGTCVALTKIWTEPSIRRFSKRT